MNILVTGSAGFLGTNLCKRLLDDGHNVVGLDNYYTGLKDNTEFLKNYSNNFKFIEHDIINNMAELDFGKLDWIMNLACPASPPHYQKDPIYTTKVSVLGVLNCMELAQSHNASLFHTSTSEVYGDPKVHPQPESYLGNVNCTGIRACYDEGKRCAESLLFDYHRTTGLPIKVVRIFNTYGPFMDPKDGRVVSNFIIQALKGEDITIYGEGLQTRSFCYVDDLIEGFIKLMNTDKNTLGPMNIGNPDEFTMIELAEKVLALTNSSSKLVFKELPKDDPTRRKPDITKAQEIGWQPKFDLNKGLQPTIEYFRPWCEK
ncbi:MAG: SDR family oxidoreductase [Bdellovibrionales bacterium]|nr:SDR family oxidoreductase [Bdellovibrionales bacterium]